MSDKNMIALAEIRNGYALNKYENLTLEQNSLIKYDNLCLSLIKEIQELKKQLEYLRSGEYYNQLRFEIDMLQYVVDNGKVSKEDKEFIDMTHRNTELLEENQSLKDRIEKAIEYIENSYYSKNTINIDDIAMTTNKCLKIREILKGDK